MDLDEFLAGTRPAPPRERKRPAIELAVEDASKRAKEGDWDEAQPKTLVGLYALMHRMIYGVMPEELTDTSTFNRAIRLAGSFMRREFGGDADATADFIVWTWEREEWREKRAAETGGNRGRIGFGLQFSKSVLTDYKTSQARRNRK